MSLNVKFRRASVEAEMEFGSLSELAGFIGEQSATLSMLFGDDMEAVVKNLATSTTAIGTGTVETAETGTEAGSGRRGRKTKDKNQPDPATASAPPPAPIPAVPAPELAAQVASAANGGGIPPFLDRTAAPPAPPAPPPAPPAPPAPVTPPSGVLAGKVIAALDARAADDSVKAQLVGWLASPGLGLVQPTATYAEAIDAIRLMSDDKLAPAAMGLQIA